MRKKETKKRIKNTISLLIFFCSLAGISIASITLYSNYRHHQQLLEEREKMQQELEKMEENDKNSYQQENGSSSGNIVIVEFPK